MLTHKVRLGVWADHSPSGRDANQPKHPKVRASQKFNSKIASGQKESNTRIRKWCPRFCEGKWKRRKFIPGVALYKHKQEFTTSIPASSHMWAHASVCSELSQCPRETEKLQGSTEILIPDKETFSHRFVSHMSASCGTISPCLDAGKHRHCPAPGSTASRERGENVGCSRGFLDLLPGAQQLAWGCSAALIQGQMGI